MRDSATFITRAFRLCLLEIQVEYLLCITAVFTAFFHAWGMQPLRVVSRRLISHAILISLTRGWDFSSEVK